MTMKSSRFSLYALRSCVAAALLAGCGGSQPPIGAPGAMPQTSALATHAAHGTSWMLPEANQGDLLYVSDAGTNAVYIFSYPGGRYVGMLDGLAGEPHGVCSDQAGNVFVTELNFGNNHVQEYTHGGTTPIATLDAPGEPEECSVDRTTGNLAVAIYTYGSGPTGVAVYVGAQGNPTTYTDPSFIEMTACSYDQHGNLFVGGANQRGFALAELPAGGSTFTDIALKSKINGKFLEPMQWHGRHLAIGSTDEFTQQYVIYRVAVSGARARVVGSTKLLLKHGYFTGDTAFFIIGRRIVLTEDFNFSESRAGLWKYPDGGTKVNETRKFGSQYSDGVTVSLAPH
jgi:hypothetical protein